jgi:hypothetical protein
MPADRTFIAHLLSKRQIAWQVVLTKCDLVSADELARRHELVVYQLQESLRLKADPQRSKKQQRPVTSTLPLAVPPEMLVDVGRSAVKWPVLMVSGKTNAGLDHLRKHILRLTK